MYIEDKKDKRIRELRENTRRSPSVIAGCVGLDAGEVRSRLKKMGLPEDRRNICKSLDGLKGALESGVAYKDMKRDFGVTSTTICYYAKKWGLTRQRPEQEPMDDNVLITCYVNDLWSICKIQRECGWSEWRISKRLKELGILRSRIETKRAKLLRRLRVNGLEYSIDGNGYPLVMAPEGVVTGRVLHNGMCFLHALEMEKKLGRPLEKSEVVHHIDFDKGNFHIDNLHLCGTKREHNQIHGTLEDVCNILYKKGVIGFNGKKYFVKPRGLEEFALQTDEMPISEPQTI